MSSLRFLTNLWKTGLRNESTIRIFWKKLYKLNPQYESLRFGFVNPNSRVLAWICKDSFCAIVLRIRQDLWGFVGFVKNGWIFGSSGHKTNPQFESLRIGLANPDLQNLWSQDLWLWYETNLFGVRICKYDTKTNPWICKTNPRFYESLIRFPHPW